MMTKTIKTTLVTATAIATTLTGLSINTSANTTTTAPNYVIANATTQNNDTTSEDIPYLQDSDIYVNKDQTLNKNQIIQVSPTAINAMGDVTKLYYAFDYKPTTDNSDDNYTNLGKYGYYTVTLSNDTGQLLDLFDASYDGNGEIFGDDGTTFSADNYIVAPDGSTFKLGIAFNNKDGAEHFNQLSEVQKIQAVLDSYGLHDYSFALLNTNGGSQARDDENSDVIVSGESQILLQAGLDPDDGKIICYGVPINHDKKTDNHTNSNQLPQTGSTNEIGLAITGLAITATTLGFAIRRQF